MLEVCHIYSLLEGKNTAFGNLQNMLRELMFSKYAMNAEFSEILKLKVFLCKFFLMYYNYAVFLERAAPSTI